MQRLIIWVGGLRWESVPPGGAQGKAWADGRLVRVHVGDGDGDSADDGDDYSMGMNKELFGA